MSFEFSTELVLNEGGNNRKTTTIRREKRRRVNITKLMQIFQGKSQQNRLDRYFYIKLTNCHSTSSNAFLLA